MSQVEMLGQSPLASDRQARPLSPATRAGDFVFVSGQVPTDDQGQVIVWLADARDFGSFNRVYMECFGDHRPARSTVESRLMIDAKVEIDVTAYKPRA